MYARLASNCLSACLQPLELKTELRITLPSPWDALRRTFHLQQQRQESEGRPPGALGFTVELTGKRSWSQETYWYSLCGLSFAASSGLVLSGCTN